MRFQLEDQIFLQPIAPDEIIFNIFFTPVGKKRGGEFIQGGMA
jgi:hypothetical protein